MISNSKISSKIKAYSIVEPYSGCWLWERAGYNYGKIHYKGRSRQAHRVSYEAFIGEIPDGLQIDHLCKTPSCVNPNHLEPVTPRENGRRSNNIGTQNLNKTICKRGHPMTLENCRYIQKTNKRECLECEKIWADTRRKRVKIRELINKMFILNFFLKLEIKTE